MSKKKQPIVEEENSKKKPDPIEFIEDNPEVIFTDIIQLNLSNETVALDLSLRNRDNKTAKITHRVYMTLSHFMRFNEAAQNLASQVKTLEEENGND